MTENPFMVQAFKYAWLSFALGACFAGSHCCYASADDRINEAMPLPKSLEYAKGELLRLATDSGERAAVESQLNAKLRVRALDCAQGYTPGPFASKEDIVAHFGATDCFERNDEALATWIGWRRVGILVKMPPLRPIPATTPEFMIGSDYIQQVEVAANAGIMLLWTNRNVDLLDLNNGKRIAHLDGLGGDLLGELSPNGRVLSTSIPGGTGLIDAESGEVLARVLSIFPRDFAWFGQDRALIRRAAMTGSFTVDFATGSETPVRITKEAIERAVARPSSRNEYFGLTGLSVLRIRAGDGPAGEPMTLLDEKPFSIQNWQRNEGELTADGRYYVIAAQDLNLIATDTLKTTAIPIGSFEGRTVVPLPDPDLILLIGDNPGVDRNMGMRYYVYSISRQTFSPVDSAYQNHGRLVFLPNINKIGFVTQNRVALLASLPVGEPMSREDFVAMMTREREQQRVAMVPTVRPLVPPRADAQPSPRVAIATANGVITLPAGIALPSGVAAGSDDRTVEGIGITEAANHVTKPDGTTQGVAIVHVKKGTGAPLSLLLSSHEAIRWMIMVEPGAVIKSILTAGPYPAEVVGARSVPVTHITDVEASQTDTADYGKLQAQVLRATGSTIHRFQGARVGTEFTVDGR